jgi:hypothetical protein
MSLFKPYAAHDGEVWCGEMTRSPIECRALLAGYLADACQADWWAPIARQRAAELEAAMREAGIIEHRSAA